jgi:hypothetical protein
MLSLKVGPQANLPAHVYSDWDLGSSVDGFVEACGQKKELDGINHNAHNNTIVFTSSHAQMAAYSPVEDKLYVNHEEALFAVFDGHGGGIFNIYLFIIITNQHPILLH